MYDIKHLLPRIQTVSEMIESDHDILTQRDILEQINDIALELSYLVEKGVESEDYVELENRE